MKNCADLGGCYPPRPSASVDNTLLDLQNITIEFMFVGINMFWVRLRLIFARAARHLEGIEKIKNEKNDKKQSEQFSGLKYILAVF